MKRTIIILVLLCSALGVYATGAADSLDQLWHRFISMDQQIAGFQNRFDRLDNRIDANGNSIVTTFVVPVVSALILGLIGFFLGYQHLRGGLQEYATQKIQKSLDADLPGECNTALKEYLKKKFPGDLNYLEEAWRTVAYDTRLRQEKRIKILSKDKTASKAVRDLLFNSGFLQVEIHEYAGKGDVPKADLLLIDRYTKGSKDQMTEQDVKDILVHCKNQSETQWVHYFGGQVDGLPAILTKYHAMSNVEFSLGPNIMDQLRFAWPMKQTKAE